MYLAQLHHLILQNPLFVGNAETKKNLPVPHLPLFFFFRKSLLLEQTLGQVNTNYTKL
jgi:hypothetical protein